MLLEAYQRGKGAPVLYESLAIHFWGLEMAIHQDEFILVMLNTLEHFKALAQFVIGPGFKTHDEVVQE